jgi:hypothetical protein
MDNKFKVVSSGYIYSFNSKNDLQSNSMQNVLKNCHKVINNIECQCDTSKKIYLIVRKVNNKYYLIRHSKTHEHSNDCIFNSLNQEFIDDNNNEVKYNSAIFDEVKGDNKSVVGSNTKEHAKNYTFNMFSQELISNANKGSFLSSLKNHDYKDLENYNFQTFCKNYLAYLYNSKISKTSFKEFFFKGEFRYEFGIVKDDIFGKINSADVNDEDIIEINLNYISLNDNKRFALKSKVSRIKFKRLRILKKLVQNFNNTTSVPYFYNAVYKNGVIVRMYIKPVYFNEEYICFVDSGYERNYAEYLYENKIFFLKPISNDELETIYSSKLGIDFYSKSFKLPHIVYTSDFILFKNNEINIIEVSGYNDNAYKAHLTKKEDYYQLLHNKYSFFKFTTIDGSKIPTVLSENKKYIWNGSETLKDGKYQGKMWSQLENSILQYYIENNFSKGKYENSIKELYRRFVGNL